MIVKGQKINDRYEIVRNIGEGGMANVYLAYDTILNRDVAVKVLRGDLADDEKFVRRFQREAISASSLSHPNIVEMYDVGEEDGNYYIVMEFIDGKTLKSLIKRRGSLTLVETIDIMSQLTSAIACAHDSYIIHRDIKAQNVMILEDGTVKITDFGIAMALNSLELTQTNSVMGSVHYLPPEQATGSGSTIKSDIYSLGILMYELLIGRVPFKGDNAVEIAIKQMKEQIPSVRKRKPDIPQSVENIILKACAKNPKNRYDNVNEMHADIINALNEDRVEEKRIVYKHPENELEATKEMRPIRNMISDGDDMKKSKTDKGLNIALIITGSILAVILIVFVVIALLIPKATKIKEIVIPDVSNMTVSEATAKLENLNLKVVDVDEKENNNIKAGKVIGTDPVKGRKVKEKSSVVIYKSLGSGLVKIEDYTDENYIRIQTLLEDKGLYVTVEKKNVENREDKDKLKNDIIIDQSIKAGNSIKKGEQIILFIPDIIVEYPNFVTENWTIDDVMALCEEYGITLNIIEKETTDYPEGKIISQSRAEGTKIISGITLNITVAAKPEVEEPPLETEE